MISLVKYSFHNERQTKERLVQFIKRAKNLSFNAECKKFEKNFAKWQGRHDCVFFSSGSGANLALIQSLVNLGKLHKGDHVAFSDLTWSTNVMPLLQLGLKAIPVDINLTTLNVSAKEIEKVLKKYPIKALFLTNVLGFCDALDQIESICKRNNILLLEDNCEALGSVYKIKKLGNFGFASSFSFFVGHHLSTIEGGAVCTNDQRLAQELRMVRAHGWDRHLDVRHQKKLRREHNVNAFYGLYTFYDLAYNLRPTEINGVLGNVQLKYLNSIVSKRQRIFTSLAQAIYSRDDLYWPIDHSHMDTISAFAFPLICKSIAIKNKIIKRCKGRIEIRPLVSGSILRQPFFKKHTHYTHKPESYKNTTLVHNQGLYLPIYPQMTKEDQKLIIDTVSLF